MATLDALLAHPLLDLARDFERSAAPLGGGVPASLLLYANVFRLVPDAGISLVEWATAARISKRAAKAALRIEKLGLVTSDDSVRGGFVRMTDAGRAAREDGEDAVRRAEREWSARIGEAAAVTARARVGALVECLEVEYPHYPMPYGTADPSMLGAWGVAARPGPPRVPGHGQDWAPVLRRSPGDVRALPMHAVLSQAYAAFAAEIEALVGLPLELARLIASLADDEVSFRDLPARLGVVGNGKTLLERHGVIAVSGEGRDRVATLTRRGAWVRANHAAAVCAALDEWRSRYGVGTVDDAVEALEAVEERSSPGLPDSVFLRYVVSRGFYDASFA